MQVEIINVNLDRACGIWSYNKKKFTKIFMATYNIVNWNNDLMNPPENLWFYHPVRFYSDGRKEHLPICKIPPWDDCYQD